MKGKEDSIKAVATRLKQSNSSKGREMELWIKKFEGKEKKKCSIGGIDWYIMWLIHKWFNTVVDEELDLSKSQNVITWLSR